MHIIYFASRDTVYVDTNEISCFHPCCRIAKQQFYQLWLLESNLQHTVQYFAADEEIEHCKYHLCIIGAVQIMLMLPSA